jgi:RNA polymerase sigma-70 factor (ECF subfamily)
MSDMPKISSLPLWLPVNATQEESVAPGTAEEEVVALFKRFRDRLLRYLCSLGLSIADGEEVIQEVFMSLFQHLQQDKSRQNLPGWIYRVTHNLGLKKRTANAADQGVFELANILDELCHDPAPSPEEQVLTRQRYRRLLGVLKAMPQQDRHCLYLRAEGLRYREIAQVLDISLGSVCQSLARTIKRLSDAEYR